MLECTLGGACAYLGTGKGARGYLRYRLVGISGPCATLCNNRWAIKANPCHKLASSWLVSSCRRAHLQVVEALLQLKRPAGTGPLHTRQVFLVPLFQRSHLALVGGCQAGDGLHAMHARKVGGFTGRHAHDMTSLLYVQLPSQLARRC
jgi:hypothetical protein